MLNVIYTLPLVDTVVTTSSQVDFAEIVAPATHVLYIHAIHLSNLTEVGDAQEENLLILAKTGATTTGAGGNAAVTPIPEGLGITAFGGSCETFNTTKATSGTIVEKRRWHWSVRMPWDPIILPEFRIRVAPSERFTLELGTTVADSITIGGHIIFGIY